MSDVEPAVDPTGAVPCVTPGIPVPPANIKEWGEYHGYNSGWVHIEHEANGRKNGYFEINLRDVTAVLGFRQDGEHVVTVLCGSGALGTKYELDRKATKHFLELWEAYTRIPDFCRNEPAQTTLIETVQSDERRTSISPIRG